MEVHDDGASASDASGHDGAWDGGPHAAVVRVGGASARQALSAFAGSDHGGGSAVLPRAHDRGGETVVEYVLDRGERVSVLVPRDVGAERRRVRRAAAAA